MLTDSFNEDEVKVCGHPPWRIPLPAWTSDSQYLLTEAESGEALCAVSGISVSPYSGETWHTGSYRLSN